MSNEDCNKDSEFMEYLKIHSDCPESIYKMAESEWQKQVAAEFWANQEDRNLIKQKLNFIEKICWATFTVVAIAAVGQFINSIVIPLLG